MAEPIFVYILTNKTDLKGKVKGILGYSQCLIFLEMTQN